MTMSNMGTDFECEAQDLACCGYYCFFLTCVMILANGAEKNECILSI